MKDNILVIGGYGQVGRIICEKLGRVFPGKIIAAGRSYKKALKFAASTRDNVIPMELDIYDPDAINKILPDIALTVMCLDQKTSLKENQFVSACIRHKSHYIDISPSWQTLSKIETLSEKAVKNNVRIILGVGLSPGLSNMLVKQISAQSDTLDAVDLFLMLGIRDKHGRNGIEWLLNHMDRKFHVIENSQEKQVKSFSDKKTALFPGNLGKRSAYRFDLADQHIIPKTIGMKSASTRFCYDSAFVTWEVAMLTKLGLFKLLKYPPVKRFFIFFFVSLMNICHLLRLGSDVYSVSIEATGTLNKAKIDFRASLFGHNNATLTGAVATIVAEQIYTTSYPPGVHYMEQLFEFDQIRDQLTDYAEFSFTSKEVS